MTEQRYSIAVVDDEVSVLHALDRLFHTIPDYEVLATTRPQDVLEALSRGAVDLVISDQRMPLMPGVDFLKKVKEVSPSTIRILLSGCTDFEDLITTMNDGDIYRFVNKPWDNQNLLTLVQDALMQRDVLRIVSRIISDLQKELKTAGAFKVETRHDVHNVHVRMELAEHVASDSEMTGLVSMLFKDVMLSSSINGESVLCSGGAVEKREGRTLVKFDLGSGTARLTVDLPFGLKAA